MYKLAFFYISAIISDAILGSNPNATKAEIEKECSKWMRNCGETGVVEENISSIKL